MRSRIPWSATAVVAAASTVLLLGGCSSGGSAGSSASTTAKPAASSVAAAPSSASKAPTRTAGADLVIWSDAQRAPVLQKFAQSFASANGIKVSVQPVSTDLQSAYVTATNAGKGPDIVVGATDWIGNLVQNGSISPLPLSATQKQAFEPTAIKAVTYDGQTYGVPYATENVALFTNTAEAPKDPATFEQLATNGENAVRTKAATAPLALQVGQQGDPYTLQPLFGSTGASIFGRKSNGQYDPSQLGVDSAAAQKFGAKLAAYGEKGKGVLKRSIDPTNAVNLFAAGKVPYLVSGPWALPQIKKANIKYAISPIPGFAGMGPAEPFLGVQAFYLSSKAKNTAIAQEFALNYLTRKDVELALYQAEPRPPALTAAYQQVAAADPDIAAFHKAAEHGVVLPQIPAMSAVWGPLGTAEAAIIGGADPSTALASAQQQIKKSL